MLRPRDLEVDQCDNVSLQVRGVRISNHTGEQQPHGRSPLCNPSPSEQRLLASVFWQQLRHPMAASLSSLRLPAACFCLCPARLAAFGPLPLPLSPLAAKPLASTTSDPLILAFSEVEPSPDPCHCLLNSAATIGPWLMVPHAHVHFHSLVLPLALPSMCCATSLVGWPLCPLPVPVSLSACFNAAANSLTCAPHIP